MLRARGMWPGRTGALTFAVLLASLPPSLEAQERRALVIGIDGLLPDAVGTDYTPTLNSLFEEGAGLLAHGYTEDLTFSGPSWSSIINGVHRDLHGVDSNEYDGHDYSAYPSFLQRLKAHDPALHTSAFVTWRLLQNNFSRPDGAPVGVDELVYHDRGEEGDVRVLEELVDLLENGDPGAAFFYQNDVDAAGHEHGFSMAVPEYREQVRTTDDLVGRALEALRNRPGVTQGEEDWMVVVVSDHGGLDTHHAGNFYSQRVIPLIVSAQGVGCESMYLRPRGVDVSRTVLTFMGVPQELQSDLDGHDLLGLCSVEPVEAAYGANLIFNGDGELDRGFSDREFDHVIAGWRDQEHTGTADGHHSMTLLRAGSDVRYTGPGNETVDSQGENIFAGGSVGSSSKVTQTLDVGGLRADIDASRTAFQLSGYLGSRGGNADRMIFTAYFLDETHDLLGTAVLDGAAPPGQSSGIVLTYHEADGLVPPGTSSIVFDLHAVGTGDGVDAFADQLSFELVPASRE